jgi:hypothetical protein
MDNSLLILKRIVESHKNNLKQKKVFDENKKCAIAIVGIKDKHTGRKPELIECFSVPDLYEKLRNYLPRGGIPPYDMVLSWVKEHGFVQLIKEINGQIRYRA